MESLSIWSLAGVALNSAVIMAVRLSTQRVWHTFNYDVTVSNGVNLCHPETSSEACDAIADEEAIFIVTDLKK